jgi:hypothetical protein
VKKSVIGSALVLGLAVAVAGPSLGGCGSTQGGSSGTGGTQAPGEGALGKISTQLTLPGGETITSVNWTISQGATTVLTGTYAVPAAATTINFFIPNVPAGSGYTITLSATSPDGAVSCVGTSAPFTVTAQQTTDVNVFLACTNTSIDGGADSGAVVVTGTPVDCATWTSAAATPAVAVSGATVQLTASAVAPAPAAITYTWTATAGTITPEASTSTAAGLATFTCPAAPATVTITLTVGDGTVPAGFTCPPASSVTTLSVVCGAVPCVGVGTGVEATPDTAAGTCPAGSANTLKDTSGNFCCAATPCFGVGTGVEATPDTSAGTCPAGQANEGLTDSAGNFCCSSAALSACTTAGQPNCVACNNGSANGLCTATEAAIVNRDISKGYITAAVAAPNGPTNGCYACLEGASALDDSSDVGQECGDTTNATECLATLGCILSTQCASAAVNVCYCGTAPVSTTCNVDGTGAANGVCDTAIAAGFGVPVTSGHTILSEFTVKTSPSGGADAIAQRAISNGCNQCWQ